MSGQPSMCCAASICCSPAQTGSGAGCTTYEQRCWWSCCTWLRRPPWPPPTRRYCGCYHRPGDAIRRAAERICARAPLAPTDPTRALADYTAAFDPVADAAGRLIAALPAGAAVHATDLLEGSVRADAAIYAAAALPFLRAHQRGSLDPYDLAFLAYGMRNAGIGLPLPQLAELAARLPADAGPVHKRVGSHISAGQL